MYDGVAVFEGDTDIHHPIAGGTYADPVGTSGSLGMYMAILESGT